MHVFSGHLNNGLKHPLELPYLTSMDIYHVSNVSEREDDEGSGVPGKEGRLGRSRRVMSITGQPPKQENFRCGLFDVEIPPIWGCETSSSSNSFQDMEVIERFSDLSTKALSVIRAARLPHPKGVLVESFVTEAADPDRAARHLLNRIAPEGEGSDVAACLDAFCSDWRQLVTNFVHEGPVQPLRDRRYVPVITRRDGGTCRFSGLGDSWRDRLAVYPILPPFGAGKIEIDSVGGPGRTGPALPLSGRRGYRDGS
ncbi:uncharacterized protein B0T15DRAFT_49015 [Chaetomium strumarium]|uniref:Uncharacterized protein n=1 Tax=Chaetomium strumarium TaxID=1170767 RepID=A0AAJ0H2Q3_9PEZI|nr:hypothetical protein B0T15DRAFT_49015 [Chaetomium strumarium]